MSTPHAGPPDPRADRDTLLELAAWCQRFSPAVGVEDCPTPESLFLDITGLEHLFGGETALAEKVACDFAERGFAVRIAIADTLGAAWAAARFGDCNLRSSLCRIPPGQTSDALRPFPIEALRLPGQIVDLLHSLGIVRVGQLELLPREELDCRFGPRLLERWDQAVGRLEEPIPVVPLPPRFDARHALEYPTASREAVSLVLERLVDRVAEMLVRCGRGAVRLECRLDCQSGTVPFTVGLFQPSASPRHLHELIAMHLERLSIPSPVTAVAIEALLTGPLNHRQEELFADGSARSRPRLLAVLIDRLAGRLGRNAVLRPRLVPEAQPEFACRYDSLVGGGKKCQKPLSAKSGGVARPEGRRAWQSPHGIHHAHRRVWACHPPRPLRLLREPIALAAISVMPEGPPVCFRFHGQEHRVARRWGPERIETGWWRGRPIARDYYRVETTTGQRFWLFRSLEEGRWFLQGSFE